MNRYEVEKIMQENGRGTHFRACGAFALGALGALMIFFFSFAMFTRIYLGAH